MPEQRPLDHGDTLLSEAFEKLDGLSCAHPDPAGRNGGFYKGSGAILMAAADTSKDEVEAYRFQRQHVIGNEPPIAAPLDHLKLVKSRTAWLKRSQLKLIHVAEQTTITAGNSKLPEYLACLEAARPEGSGTIGEYGMRATIGDVQRAQPAAASVLLDCVALQTDDRYVSTLTTEAEAKAGQTMANQLRVAADEWAAANPPEDSHELELDIGHFIFSPHQPGSTMRFFMRIQTIESLAALQNKLIAQNVQPPSSIPLNAELPVTSYGIVFEDEDAYACLQISGDQPVVTRTRLLPGYQPDPFMFVPGSSLFNLNQLSGETCPLADAEITPYYERLQAGT